MQTASVVIGCVVRASQSVASAHVYRDIVNDNTGGKRKLYLQWCRNGVCVHDGRAPPAPDSCIYGDHEGPLENGLRCRDIPVRQPWMCYEERYQDMCCETCDSIRNPDRPGNSYVLLT